MSETNACQLTTKDYTILEVMLERHFQHDEVMSGRLRRKTSDAVVMFREDIPTNVVTLSSSVAYRVDGGPSEVRIIAHDQMRGLVGMILPITNPRGLALLGLAEGQSITIPGKDGLPETLTVTEVMYQPEADRREKAAGDGDSSTGSASKSAPFLRLVSSTDTLPPAKPKVPMPADNGFDDPGPSAA